MEKARKTILVVEDEAVVLNVVRTALDRAGYHVLEADSAQEAERVFEQQHHEIDLLMVDLQLDGDSGADVARTLRERVPGLRVVLTSGGEASDLAHSVAAVPNARFIQKPYSLVRLAETIGEVLAESRDDSD